MHRFGSIFREIVNKTASTKLSARINFLAEVPAFRNMDPVKLAKLGSALEETEYAAGTNVITQGETGDRFYILESGNVDVLLDPLEPEEGDDEPIEDTPTEPVKVGSLQPGDWFGEMALLNDSPRAATVKALGAVRTLSVNRLESERRRHRAVPCALARAIRLMRTAWRVAAREGAPSCQPQVGRSQLQTGRADASR